MKKISITVSKARIIVECCIGLLKMKWRRLHGFRIKEYLRIVPQIILCACILHNISIEENDVNGEEERAMRSEEERQEEVFEERRQLCQIVNDLRASQADIAAELIRGIFEIIGYKNSCRISSSIEILTLKFLSSCFVLRLSSFFLLSLPVVELNHQALQSFFCLFSSCPFVLVAE